MFYICIYIYISISCFAGFVASLLQKNTANTIWLGEMIIYIVNVTLVTLYPMVILT